MRFFHSSLFVEMVMTLTSNNPAPQVTGTVSNASWVATNLIAVRATNALPSAEYTLLIPPDTNNAQPTNSPGGDGYALITNGTLDFGKLSGPATPLNGSIAAKTGLLKVTFGSGASKTTGYGVILLNGTNGGGYFLNKANAGSVILEP
jgi:hypothetical protein